MRLQGQTQHVAGWMGGVIERAEPDQATGQSINGRVRSGTNFVHGGTGRLALRGGARRALTLLEQSIDNLPAIFRWSPTGAILVGHSSALDKHYVYALGADGALILPAGTPTESGSRADLGWDVATPRWAQAAELFETLFVADTADSVRQTLKAIKLTGGALAVSSVQADLDGDTTAADMKPSGVFVYGSVLFAYGWEDEAVGAAPHILRHSFLGQDPADVVGWDADAYAIVGAQGEPIRAAQPGQDIALVAKYAELFRVFGDPDALPGWQFRVQPVNASVRLGAVNQHALCYDEDRWWGIGRDGPWTFDGKTGTSLVGSRRERWGQVGDLSAAFVEAHPRRGAIVFGFPEPASLVAGTRASRLWVFDTQSDKWAPDFVTPSRFYMLRTVAQTGVAIDDIPDDLTWLFENGFYETHAITLEWAAGDASAATEVWIKPSGGSYALAATLPAGVRGVRLSGLPLGTSYTAKVRHRKGDALTEFGTEASAYTRIAAPRVTKAGRAVPPVAGSSDMTLIVPDAGRTLSFETLDSDNNVSTSIPNVGTGTVPIDLFPASGFSPHLTVTLQLSQGANTSPLLTIRNAVYVTLPVNGIGTYQPTVAVSQQFNDGAFAATSLDVLITSGMATFQLAYANTLTLKYRVFGSATWLTWAVLPYAQNVLQTITGLSPSTRYEVQVTLHSAYLGVDFDTDPVPAFTKISTPTATIATAGAGTPVANITVIPPDALPGFDTLIISAGSAFDSTYANVSTDATVYQSTVGTCEVPLTYWVRGRSTQWPEGYQHSDPVELTVANACVISP